MRRELTEKQQEFARKYIELGNASQAYREAYKKNYKTDVIKVKACELLAKPQVQEYVEELRAKHAKIHGITIHTLLDELEEARQIAINTGNSSSAVSATMGKAKILGMDKQIIDLQTGGKPLPTLINVSFGDNKNVNS